MIGCSDSVMALHDETDTAASAQAGAYFPSEFASCLVSHGPCFSKGGGGGGDDIFEKCQDWTQL